jgi:hypothetical protein
MASTRDRVPRRTDEDINRRIQQNIEISVSYYERQALKALRGDFDAVRHAEDRPRAALTASLN